MFEEPLPKNKAGQPQEHTPYEIHRSNEYFQREYLVAVQEIKILQARAHIHTTYGAATIQHPLGFDLLIAVPRLPHSNNCARAFGKMASII